MVTFRSGLNYEIAYSVNRFNGTWTISTRMHRYRGGKRLILLYTFVTDTEMKKLLHFLFLFNRILSGILTLL